MTFQVSKSSSDFWNNLKLTWKQCADLSGNCWATSVAELDGNVYAAVQSGKGACVDPLMYDSKKDQWFTLPALPYGRFSLVTVPDWKQLLAIGGEVNNNGVIEISNKVFIWNEKDTKWTTPYPKMPTARFRCSSISHGSSVVVAGGITCWDPWTVTRVVEVLHIKEHSWFTKSHWSVVEPLPFVVHSAVPLIVNDQLYIASGSDEIHGPSTSNILTASLPELLQSSNKKNSSGQVWNKLPDMPFSSFSINHYQGCLITFGGHHWAERLHEDKPHLESVPLIHIYNPHTKTWERTGEIPYGYLLGRSIHIRESKLLFIGGLTGKYDTGKDDNMITTCLILTLSPRTP